MKKAFFTVVTLVALVFGYAANVVFAQTTSPSPSASASPTATASASASPTSTSTPKPTGNVESTTVTVPQGAPATGRAQ